MGECPICKRTDTLTRHHLVPKAAGGDNSDGNIVRICRLCHSDVHAFYGLGHEYSGPKNGLDLIESMQGPVWTAWRAMDPELYGSRKERTDDFIRLIRKNDSIVRKSLWLYMMERHNKSHE